MHNENKKILYFTCKYTHNTQLSNTCYNIQKQHSPTILFRDPPIHKQQKKHNSLQKNTKQHPPHIYIKHISPLSTKQHRNTIHPNNIHANPTTPKQSQNTACQPNPHLILALLECLYITNKNKNKHLVHLDINIPICPSCQHFLKHVVAYNKHVASNIQGCQQDILTWTKIPPLALQYLNDFIKKSNTPFDTALTMLSTLQDIPNTQHSPSPPKQTQQKTLYTHPQ